MMVEVLVKKEYFDLELKKTVGIGKRRELSVERAKRLSDLGVCDIIVIYKLKEEDDETVIRNKKGK